MLVNTERIKFKSQKEVNIVKELSERLNGKVSIIKVRRQPMSFGATASPYKAKKKGNTSILDLNLGVYRPESYDVDRIVSFITSERVQKFFNK